MSKFEELRNLFKKELVADARTASSRKNALDSMTDVGVETAKADKFVEELEEATLALKASVLVLRELGLNEEMISEAITTTFKLYNELEKELDK